MVQDNGLKMISEDGGMLHQELEKFAEDLINEECLEKAVIQ